MAVLVLGASPAGAQEQTGDSVVARGFNGFGQGTVPSGLSNVKAIAAGGFHSLALKEDGTVVAWGNDGSGQSTAPPDLSDVRAISAGGVHGLAMRDLISPTVTAVKPADDATGIGPGTNVSAFFSEAMTAGSIDTTTVKLFKASEDSARKAIVTYDGAANRATLVPNADLRRGDRYRVKVTTGTKNLAGNRLDQGPSNGYQRMVWRFTVGN
jgi:hypothetical protein